MNNKVKLVFISLVWLVIIAVSAVAWKFIYRPKQEQVKQEVLQQEHQKMVESTSASSRYDTQINFAIDGFVGFAGLRTPFFQAEMAKQKIKVNLIDDGANYPNRIKAFQDGSVQMGVFTLDALISACSTEKGVPPATVIAFIDETRGADAMVAYKDAFPNIDSLNASDVKIVRPDGPSDTLTRVVSSQFRMNNLNLNNVQVVSDASAVYDIYRKAKQTDRQVYVLWEPWIGKVLDNPNAHVIVDSSRFRGYILDVMVVNRDFLYKNPEIVKSVVKAYLTTLYHYKNNMSDLMVEDAKITDQPLSQKDAKRVLDGLWMKNTQDNFAHMGLLDTKDVQNVEDMIGNITKVLVSTKAIPSDPTNGKPGLLYYDGILRQIKDENFFPGNEKLRNDQVVLQALTADQWKSLVPIGSLEVPQLVFARGTATLTGSSEQTLTDLVQTLKTWPQYYVNVVGNASNIGDIQANADLAKARAQAAADYLVTQGVEQNRINAVANVTGETSVSFILGQSSY